MYKATPLSRNSIRQIAKFFRKVFNINNPYVDILRILEIELSKKDLDFELEIVDDDSSELPFNVYAKAYPEESRIVVKKSVYDAAKNGQGRARFTMAHELFHYLWHGRENIQLCRSEEIKIYEDVEWQANTFAAEFLVPEYIALTNSIDQIVDICQVSREVAAIQKKCTNRVLS